MINSDDNMSAPALPALASLQLRKCKGIRDLTARAGSNSPAGPGGRGRSCIFGRPKQKPWKLKLGQRRGIKGLRVANLDCRHSADSGREGSQVDGHWTTPQPPRRCFPLRQGSRAVGSGMDGGRLDMCDKSRLHFQTMTTSVGEGAGRLASLALGAAQTSSPISMDI